MVTEPGPSVLGGGLSCALPVGTHRLPTPIPGVAVTPADHSGSLKPEPLPSFQGNLLSLVAVGEVSRSFSPATQKRRTC